MLFSKIADNLFGFFRIHSAAAKCRLNFITEIQRYSSLTITAFLVGGKKKEGLCFQKALSKFKAEHYDW